VNRAFSGCLPNRCPPIHFTRLEEGRVALALRSRTVSTGTVNVSFAPIGSNLPDFDNFFCRDCGRIIHVRKGSPGFRACPTPGCTRTVGFGVYASVPWPSRKRQF
jgi:hypothetical protein